MVIKIGQDGADIEIVGLLKSTTRWLSELYKDKVFPHKGVNVYVNELYPDESCFLPYSEWDLVIQQNFEQQFYVPIDPSEDSKHTLSTNNW
jgi:glycogen debranching enzyme